MKVMLDTNTCIAIIKRKPPSILSKLAEYQIGDIGISTVTLSELKFGVEKSQYQEKNRLALANFIIPLVISNYDEIATDHYAKIRAYLEKKGHPIGPLDTMIAAHAQSLDVILITNNTKEFSRIPTLRIHDWLVE